MSAGDISQRRATAFLFVTRVLRKIEGGQAFAHLSSSPARPLAMVADDRPAELQAYDLIGYWAEQQPAPSWPVIPVAWVVAGRRAGRRAVS